MAAGLVIIVAAVLPATASGTPGSPSSRQERIDHFRQEVADARAKLDALNQQADIADEGYLPGTGEARPDLQAPDRRP